MTDYRLKTVMAARGRWHEILPALGIAQRFLNRKPQDCPVCRAGTDRFQYDNVYNDGNSYCRKCANHSRTGFQLLMDFHGWDFRQTADQIDSVIGNTVRQTNHKPADPRWASYERTKRDQQNKLDKSIADERRKKELVERLWGESRDISEGDPVDRYLTSRGITVRPPFSLRYHPRCYHWGSKADYPAMIAVFARPQGCGTFHALHQTFLTPDGRKAEVKRNRLFTFGALPPGGAIKLQAPDVCMGIAEGIETALSAHQLFDMPVWALTGRNIMQKFCVPDLVRHLVIFADRDERRDGEVSAEALKVRLEFEAQEAGIDRLVEIRMPDSGKDWNDVLQQQGGKNAIVEA